MVLHYECCLWSREKYLYSRNLFFVQIIIDHFKFLIVGGGSGGLATSAKLRKKFPNQIAIIEPSKTHFYQPGWTLVGGGLTSIENVQRPLANVVPKNVKLFNEPAIEIDPDKQFVQLKNDRKISYEYLIISVGIKSRPDLIKGFREALDNDPNVVTVYSGKYVTKVQPAVKGLKEGNAIFTYPSTPIKCPGAPQKVMWMAENKWRDIGRRNNINISFNSAVGAIFGVKKYADALMKVKEKRNVQLNLNENLVEIDDVNRLAIFQSSSDPNKKRTEKYDLLHVGMPHSGHKIISSNPKLSDATGLLDVVKGEMRQVNYPNIFGIGDCTNSPNSKTVAAVGSQVKVVYENLIKIDKNDFSNLQKYDGYAACPLITGYGRCILAEFDYDLQPLETFPVDQGVERRTMYHMKVNVMPQIYWHMLLTGNWNGTGTVRKMAHLGLSK
ncbi:hypothetical protein SNEBB_004211 [Seison nebaliae]|nr:hypothetical protein SNEBB_004211 [Seison nebaliae]